MKLLFVAMHTGLEARDIYMFRFTNLPNISQSNTIIIIVSVSNHRKDKKVGGVTQGRHLSDMGATFPHCALQC